MRRWARDVATWTVFAVLYAVVAKLGLAFASVTSSVTLVWPSSGLALAAMLLFGRRLWPGVALGAFFTNASTPGVGLLVALGISVGNTLEAFGAAYVLQRFGFKTAMARVADVLRLLALAAIASTTASAAIGVLSLWLGGILPTAGLSSAFRVWWLGDLMGDLLVAPVLLTLASSSLRRPSPARVGELAALLVALLAAALSGFGLLRHPGEVDFPQFYTVFPLLVWAALRFGVPGAAGCNLMVSAISIAATVRGVGPFARTTLNESLFQLQAFMAVTFVTSLVLGAAVAERDRAISLRDDFLSLASHELNTPLTALQLDVESLGRMLARGGAPPEKLRHRVEHTEAQVGRLRALVARLLDSSQIAAGRLVLVTAPMDLVVLAREATEPFANELRRAGRALELTAPPTVVGEWDRMRLELVLGNLLSNAVKYGGEGAVVVVLEATDAEATLRVQDHGIGISEAARERVFERFERAVSRNNYPGFGLGLWITRTVVHAMGGRIDLASEMGVGTTFTVTLPRAPSPPKAAG